jgi:hypothetical protein
MSKFVDQEGLLYFWTKLKTILSGKVDTVEGKQLSTNDYTNDEKDKLSGIAAKAEVNQNAYSYISVGSSKLSAAGKTDTVTIAAGTNVTLTPDTTNGKITIAATDTTYSNATTTTAGLMSSTDKAKLDTVAENANNYTLPTASKTLGGVKTTSDVNSASGYTASPIIDGVVYYKDTDTTYNDMTGATSSKDGTNGLVPKPVAGNQDKYLRGDGTWQTPTDTTYSAVTTSKDGLMIAADKSKLDGIADNANNYSLPTATSSVIGGVTTTSTVTSTTGYTASPIIDGVVYYKDTNTTYNAVTTTANGLMTSTDKAKLDAFGAASTYALKSDITNMYKYKGSVATTSDLPSGATTGDVYNVEASGMNYAWDGSTWDALGEIFTIDKVTNSEIDTIMAS